MDSLREETAYVAMVQREVWSSIRKTSEFLPLVFSLFGWKGY
jgi:hypothetical protein